MRADAIATIAEDQADALMIQCDTCKCWQHGPCVGLWGEKVSNPLPHGCTGVRHDLCARLMVCRESEHRMLTPSLSSLAGLPRSILLRALSTRLAWSWRVSPHVTLCNHLTDPRSRVDFSAKPIEKPMPPLPLPLPPTDVLPPFNRLTTAARATNLANQPTQLSSLLSSLPSPPQEFQSEISPNEEVTGTWPDLLP